VNKLIVAQLMSAISISGPGRERGCACQPDVRKCVIGRASPTPPKKKGLCIFAEAVRCACALLNIPGTCVQHPGLQGGGVLGDALTPGTPAGSMAASAHEGTYSHVSVVGGASGGERGATSATAAAAAPAGVAPRPRARPSLRRAADLRTAGRAAETAHGRAGGADRRVTRRL